MDDALKAAIRAVELARRAQNYSLMRSLASAVLRDVQTLSQPVRGQVLSRVLYERHMAAFQQAHGQTGTRRQTMLQRSRELAEHSAHEAEAAGDEVGALFTLMNISGLILPALGRYEEAYHISEEASAKAERIANVAETSEEDRSRAWRVARNCYFHRIRLLIAGSGSRMEVARLLRVVHDNQVMLRLPDHHELGPDIAAAVAYIVG